MIATLAGMGLSAAAGLNAYIPFLIVALVARFTDFITLPQSLEWVQSPWAIGIGSVLLLTEVVLDKIPAIDSLNDTVQTLIRPSMGGLMFAATSAAETLDHSSFMQENSWVGVVLGIVTSGLVHAGKAAVRPAIDAGTLGTGTPVVSTAEDTMSIGMSLAALFAPVLVIFGLIIIGVALFYLIRMMLRWRRKLKNTKVMQRVNGTAPPASPA